MFQRKNADLKKKLLNFSQKYRFWPILTTYVQTQSQLSQLTDKISENLFLLVDDRIFVSYFELSISFGLRGVAVLQVNIFQKAWF